MSENEVFQNPDHINSMKTVSYDVELKVFIILDEFRASILERSLKSS